MRWMPPTGRQGFTACASVVLDGFYTVFICFYRVLIMLLSCLSLNSGDEFKKIHLSVKMKAYERPSFGRRTFFVASLVNVADAAFQAVWHQRMPQRLDCETFRQVARKRYQGNREEV